MWSQKRAHTDGGGGHSPCGQSGRRMGGKEEAGGGAPLPWFVRGLPWKPHSQEVGSMGRPSLSGSEANSSRSAMEQHVGALELGPQFLTYCLHVLKPLTFSEPLSHL